MAAEPRPWLPALVIAAAYVLGFGIGDFACDQRGHRTMMSRHWVDPSFILAGILLGVAVQRRWPTIAIAALGLATPVPWFAHAVASELSSHAAMAGSGAPIITKATVLDWALRMGPATLAAVGATVVLRGRRAKDSPEQPVGLPG